MTRRACRPLVVGLLLLVSAAMAEEGPPTAAAPDAPPARVMLLGLFHFDNPGLDAVRYEPIDVMQPVSQAYLADLAKRIAAFAPTQVLLEYPEQSDAAINRRYAEYLAGQYELGRNEIYQLGFRIAKLAGHSRVNGFDRAAPAFDDPLWAWLETGDPATNAKVMSLIDSLSARLQHEHQTLTLRQILAKENTPESELENKGFYMLLNPVGADRERYYGADSTANWWHRNLRMYAVIQTRATPRERLVVIAGAGHTAILRDLLRADSERLEEPVAPYLVGPASHR